MKINMHKLDSNDGVTSERIEALATDVSAGILPGLTNFRDGTLNRQFANQSILQGVRESLKRALDEIEGARPDGDKRIDPREPFSGC